MARGDRRNPGNGNIVCSPAQFQRVVNKEINRRVGRAPGDVKYLKSARNALGDAQAVNQNGYYSQIRFQATGVVGTYTVDAGVRSAFSYGRNNDMASAGFPAGTIASLTNTNLSKGSETRAGETYFIHGISCEMSTASEIALAGTIWANANVEISLNGGLDAMPIGRLEFMGRIHGTWFTRLIAPALDDNQQSVAIGQNATPEDGSVFMLDPPLVWTPSGNQDSQLVINVTLPEAFTIPSTARVAAAGVTAYDPPDPDLVFVDLTFRLIGESVTNVSVNQ